MKLTLHIWRQRSRDAKGDFETYTVEANEHMSFLEMLDVLNQDLIDQKKEPVAFEHDCREGIFGSCSMVINGRPHGPHLGIMPQGKVENERRVQVMVNQMDKEGFGACSNAYACEAECPKEISVSHIARLFRYYMKSNLTSKA